MRGSKAERAPGVNDVPAPWALLGLVLAALLGACSNDVTHSPYPSHCDNGRRDGNESHVDCGGSCAACEPGAGCVVPSDCQSHVCSSAGFCLIASCKDGARNSDETDIDCGGTCDGCAGGKTCASDNDCSSQVCKNFRCADTSCGDGEQNADESDVDCGGGCEGCAPKKHCNGDEDCESLVCNGDSHMCAGPTCEDGVKNQGETAIDCGGEACDPCDDGAYCDSGTDCASGNCFINRCISCDDGLQNGMETGRDCGGGCEACRAKEGCKVNEDCISKVCDDQVCAASACDDGVQNQDESDVDCGGKKCDACDVDKHCSVAADCDSKVCTDNVCIAPTCSDGVRNGGESDIDCGGETDCDRCRDLRECTAPADCISNACDVYSGCGSYQCTSSRWSPTSGYRYCVMRPMTVGCPNITGTGTELGIATYGDKADVTLPFSFKYGKNTYGSVTVQSYGALTFDGENLPKDNVETTISTDPNDIIAVFWDDLDASFAGSRVLYRVVGSAPKRRFVVRWEIGANTTMSSELGIFSVVLEEDGSDIHACYTDTDFGDQAVNEGRSATAGVFVDGSPLVYAHNWFYLDPLLEIIFYHQ